MVYFVTEDYLKTETPITKNVDIQNVAPWVRPACETRLVPILGRHFFKYLLTKYNAQNLTPEEVELVKVIQPCVAWRAGAMAVYGTSRPLKNTGIQQLNSENSSGVNLEEVTFGMETYNQIAAEYQRTLKEYILDNREAFPEFMSEANKDASLRKACSSDVTDSDTDVSILVI